MHRKSNAVAMCKFRQWGILAGDIDVVCDAARFESARMHVCQLRRRGIGFTQKGTSALRTQR
eukprot:9927318-Lingulodinium_polyedra.AAC.1